MCSHLAKIAKCSWSNSSRKKMLAGDRKKENKARRALNSSLACVTSGKASGGPVERIFRNKCKEVRKSDTPVSALSFVMPTYPCLGMMSTKSYNETYNWHMMIF